MKVSFDSKINLVQSRFTTDKKNKKTSKKVVLNFSCIHDFGDISEICKIYKKNTRKDARGEEKIIRVRMLATRVRSPTTGT